MLLRAILSKPVLKTAEIFFVLHHKMMHEAKRIFKKNQR